MKYFSENLNKLFDSVDALNAAEAKAKAEKEAAELKRKQEEQAKKVKNEARAKDAREVDEAFKAMSDAQKAYRDKLSNFCSKWGAYHTSINYEDMKGEQGEKNYSSIVDAILDTLFS